MKKERIIIIFLALIIIGMFTFYIISQKNKTLRTDNLKNIWEIYDKDLNNIKTNLSEISIKNDDWEWWELKNFDIKDDDLKNTYNSILADIRMCYIYATDTGEQYTNSNPIAKYRNTETISKKDLKVLQNNTKDDVCLNAFEKYDSIKLSNDDKTSAKIKERIDIINSIYETDIFTNITPTFDEMLSRETIKINMISNLSNWLKQEYYVYK